MIGANPPRRGKRVRAQTGLKFSVRAATTGVLATIGKFGLLPPVAFTKTTGHANLSIDGETGDVSDAAGISISQTKSIGGKATGADGVVIPFSADLTALPALALSAATFDNAWSPGTLIGMITGVPAGATPIVTPNDGRWAIGGSELGGWKLVVGASASSPSSVPISISAPGAIKISTTLVITGEMPAASWSITGPLSVVEGNSGQTDAVYYITLANHPGTGTLSIRATASGFGANPVSTSDIVGGTFPQQTFVFSGSGTQTFTVPISRDTTVEQDEGLRVTLDNASAGIISVATADTTITNDDLAAPTINAIGGDNVINASEVTTAISGTAMPGATVTISLGGLQRTVAANGSGIYSYNLTAPDITACGQGAETISVTQTVSGVTSPAATRNVSIDSLPPTISGALSVSATGALNNYLNAGDVLTVIVPFSEAVYVVTSGGTPRIPVPVGSTTRYAVYVSGSGTQNLTFQLAIVDGDADSNGISITSNSVALNGGTIKDAAGNNADLSHAAVADMPTLRVKTSVAAPFIALFDTTTDGCTHSEFVAGDGIGTVLGETGALITLFLSDGTHSVEKEITGTGSPQAIVMDGDDLAILDDGKIGIYANQVDTAGNVSPDTGTQEFSLGADLLIYPLDLVTDDPIASYSVARRMRESYTGALIRVTRDWDSAEQDIGTVFNGSYEELDADALIAWVTGAGAHPTANGFVKIVYNQREGGDAGIDMKNAGPGIGDSSMPRIVEAGALVTRNGRPAMHFYQTSNRLFGVFESGEASQFSYDLVAAIEDPSRFMSILMTLQENSGSSGAQSCEAVLAVNKSGEPYRLVTSRANNADTDNLAGYEIGDVYGDLNLFSGIYDADSVRTYLNNVLKAEEAYAAQPLLNSILLMFGNGYGANAPDYQFIGWFCEANVFLNARSDSNRNLLANDRLAFFGGASVPNQITDLTLVPSNQQALVDFTPPADGGSDIIHYEWRYRELGNVTWIEDEVAQTIASKAEPIGAGVFENGQPYQVQLAAVNGVGRGEWSDTASVTPNAEPFRIGMNVCEPHWPSVPFANLALHFRWSNVDSGGHYSDAAREDYASDWYPTAIPAGGMIAKPIPLPAVVTSGQVAEVDCTLTFTGTGSYHMFNARNIAYPAPGVITFTMNIADGEPQFRITAQSGGSPIRALDCRVDGTSPTDLFDPIYIEEMQRYDTVRFMKWAKHNEDNGAFNWAQRCKPGDGMVMGFDAVPIEYIVALCNLIGCNLWYAFGINTSEDYVRNTVAYIKAHLAPGLKALFECGNEMWNWGYAVVSQLHAEGMALGLGGPGNDGNLARWRRAAQYSVQLMDLVEDEWGEPAGDNWSRVISWQNAGSGWGGGLTYVLNESDAGHKHDYLAVNIYYQYPGGWIPVDMFATEPEAAAWMVAEDGCLALIDGQITDLVKCKTEGATWGLKTISYEMGHHLQCENLELLGWLLRSEEQTTAHTYLLDRFEAVNGGLAGMFNTHGGMSVFGCWGHREIMGLDKTHPMARRQLALENKMDELEAA